MGAPQYEQAGADIGGSGTTNTIPRWTGASTLGDSVITQSGSNIGIGTASPGAQLQVERAGGLSNAEYLRLRNTTSGNGSAVAQDYYVHANTVATGRIQHTWNGTTYDTTLSVWNNSLSSLQEAVRVQGGGNVGIGTASPGAILHTLGTGTTTGIFATSSANSWIELRRSTSTTLGYIGTGSLVTGGAAADLAFRCESGNLLFSTVATERARIDSTGNLILNTATTGATIQAAGSQQGLKLPATPGNGNANTLDSYQEGTRVLSAGDLSGWTYVTATQYWTLVGRTVTLHTVFTGGTSSATGGATIATPPLLTPLRIAAGAAVNSSGTALGNGVCVVASTSSTTGTVITSNAISSSAVDKVLTVTYETAGL